MEPASLLLLLALSAIVAIVSTKLNSVVMASTWGKNFYGNGSFLRATATATLVIFLSLILASFVLGAVDSKPRLP